MQNSLQNFIGRHRIILSIIAGLFFIFFSTPTQKSLLIGSPIILLGEATRIWASGFIKKDKELAVEGPYALTRNPLYLGSFMIGIGFSIMAGNMVLIAIFIIAFLIIYTLTIKNEEMSLQQKFGDSFIAYKKRVPVFFPYFSSGTLKEDKDIVNNFDWHLVIKHREHHTWLGIAGCLIIFIIKALSPAFMAVK